MSRHSGNTYMMHSGVAAGQQKQQSSNNMQASYMRHLQRESSNSTADYHLPQHQQYRSVTALAGSNTGGSSSQFTSRHVAYQLPPQMQANIVSGVGIVDQQSSSVSAAVITRGVPSQEIRYEDQQPYKKEEKESHYSRHVNSNSSFGGGALNNARTIFDK